MALASDEVQTCVADGGEEFWRGAGEDVAGVFAERHVAGVEQTVLDLPMVAGKLRQAVRSNLVGG